MLQKCYFASEKCKLKPQWAIVSHLSESLLSKKEKKKQVNVGKDVGGNKNVCALLVGMLNGTAIMENCMGIPQKTNRTTIWSSNLLLSIYPKKWKF